MTLFVYGTLQPGHLRWPTIGGWVVGRRPAEVDGRLYDTGLGYPAARFDERGTVAGWALDVAPGRRARVLALLDRIEGAWYERVEVRTRAGESATTYGWIGPLDLLTPMSTAWTADGER